MAATSACIGVGARLLLRSAQTNELLRVKLVKQAAPEQTGYNGPRKQGPKQTSFGEYENGLIQVSEAAPLGRALLGKVRGDIVTVEAPAGVFAWEIIEVLNKEFEE